MNPRDKILNAISSSQPSPVTLPVIDLDAVIRYDDVPAQFQAVLESIGGTVVMSADLRQLATMIDEEKKEGKYIINTIQELGQVDNNLAELKAYDLAMVEKAYIRGVIGVAENGAIWLYEDQLVNRLLPFICQHLVLVIDRKDIAPTMHHAYQRIDIAAAGFGVFIAGPSKTADIEQSLVIGAHGARSLVAYIL